MNPPPGTYRAACQQVFHLVQRMQYAALEWTPEKVAYVTNALQDIAIQLERHLTP